MHISKLTGKELGEEETHPVPSAAVDHLCLCLVSPAVMCVALSWLCQLRAKSYEGEFSAALLDCDEIPFIFHNWEFLCAEGLMYGCTVC